MQREKRTKSGRLMEVEFYPVLADGRRVPTRAPKTKRSTPEQARYNQKQAKKNFIRLVNANFSDGDIFMHPTFTPASAAYDEKCARREMANYFRRVKYVVRAEIKSLKKEEKVSPSAERRKKIRLLEGFRYAYRIAESVYKSGKQKGQKSFHFHIFMTGGLPRDVYEELWGLGRANADRYRPEEFGPLAAALYASKVTEGALRFGYSKNLERPTVSEPIDGKITARGVERLATLHIDDAAFWERRYRGYKFLRCYACYNEYNGYWYVSAMMYKPRTDGEEIPSFAPDDWLDEF